MREGIATAQISHRSNLHLFRFAGLRVEDVWVGIFEEGQVPQPCVFFQRNAGKATKPL
jgi:hypothetical protein